MRWITKRNQDFEDSPREFNFGEADEKILELAVEMFDLREELDFERGEERIRQRLELLENPNFKDKSDLLEFKAKVERESELHCRVHSLSLKEKRSMVARVFKANNCDEVEREIILFNVAGALAIGRGRRATVDQMVERLTRPGRGPLAVLRRIGTTAPLLKNGILDFDDCEPDLQERKLRLDPELQERILTGRVQTGGRLSARTLDELWREFHPFQRFQRNRVEALDNESFDRGHNHQVKRWSRRCDLFLDRLDRTLQARPAWPIAKFYRDLHQKLKTKGRGPNVFRDIWSIVLTLLCDGVVGTERHADPHNGLYLARSISHHVDEVIHNLKFLGSRSFLILEGLIQPCGGPDPLLTDAPADLQDAEFELTEKAISEMQIPVSTKRKREGHYVKRQGLIQLNQLVLKPSVVRAVELALSHVRQQDLLFTKWKLGKTFTYGRGMTLLFSGSPGTGKTACAEAIARELDKPILVADYSKIQNCFVGQTEKNIVQVFAEAKKSSAVLFWDEADAMFFDRDSATRNWEVRDVNVLLQEVEKFDGICILATNRRTTLDKALARRISLKVEFDPPDRLMRLHIIRKLLPKTPALERGAVLDWLADQELSGGQFKNIILNAIRFAALRDGSKAKLKQEDFAEALKLSEGMNWERSGAVKRVTGFGG